MKIASIILVFIGFVSSFTQGQIISQWRGEHRNGIYHEEGLLKAWPEEGPQLLWYNDSLPKGHSSAAVDGDMVYLTGLMDTLDCLLAIDNTGKVIWQTAYGKAFMESFQDSRSTPTIDGDRIYVQSSMCDIACINKTNGELVWKVEAFNVYQGKVGTWGYSESVLVVNNKVLVSPSGLETAMVAFDKLTGKELWKTESLNDTAAYVSPILIHENGKDIAINVSANYVYGVNVANGKILFKNKYSEVASEASMALWPSAPKINTNSVYYANKELYVTSGYNHSGVKYKLANDLSQLTVIWADSVLDVHHGGFVVVDGYIYGSNWLNNSNGNWCCVNWETGKAEYEREWQNKGSVIYNDGFLYCYDEKRGNIALVEASPKEFKVTSEFKIPMGRGPHWSHPVINKGKLYVRHANALMVYNISSN